jgi:hypothetical protein
VWGDGDSRATTGGVAGLELRHARAGRGRPVPVRETTGGVEESARAARGVWGGFVGPGRGR